MWFHSVSVVGTQKEGPGFESGSGPYYVISRIHDVASSFDVFDDAADLEMTMEVHQQFFQ